MILALLLFLAQMLPPGTTLMPGTTQTYQNGAYTWAGNPFCVSNGNNWTLQPTSPAIDAGALIAGFHCPNPGSAIGQPAQANGSPCVEWYGKAPDIGSCEFYVAAGPPLVCTVGTGTLTGCYYTDQNFANLGLVRDDGTSLNFDWGNGSPDPAIPPDHFSVKWEGNFNFTAGLYQFNVTVDDGVRLFVDGQVIIDEWFDQAPTNYSAQQQLAAGTHDVKMEYYEDAGGAVAKLNWNAVALPPSAPQGLGFKLQ